MEKVSQATGNLFRVVGWLFTLLLSLTFTDVVGELSVTETAIESEATAIANIDHDLRRFGCDQTNRLKPALVAYTQSVVDDDLPALAQGLLSAQTDELLRDLEDAALDLKGTNPAEQTMQSRIMVDVDLISDYRLSRLKQAQEQPSQVLIVVFFGYLATMVLFGIYQPRRVVLGLLSCYTTFVGGVIYMIIALSDPFHAANAVDSAPFEYALKNMASNESGNVQ